jgi:hypothetical protein
MLSAGALPCALVTTAPDVGFWAQLGEREQALVLAVAHERRVGAGRRLF